MFSVYLEDSLGNLHHPGLEREGDGGVARGKLYLHQAPDAVTEFQGLVDHVLAFQGPLSNGKSLIKFK